MYVCIYVRTYVCIYTCMYVGVFFWDWEPNPHAGTSVVHCPAYFITICIALYHCHVGVPWPLSYHRRTTAGGRCDGGAFSFTPANKLAEGVMRKYFNGSTYTDRDREDTHKAASSQPQFSQLQDPHAEVGAMRGTAGGLSVYSNGVVGQGWQDYTYNCNKNLKESVHALPGHQFCAHAQCSNWGAISFHSSRSLNSQQYTHLSFDLTTCDSTAGVQVALYGAEDARHPFPALFAAHYLASCTLVCGEWSSVQIPIKAKARTPLLYSVIYAKCSNVIQTHSSICTNT